MSQNGKGDTPRPVNFKQYEENYQKLFGDTEVLWERTCPKCKNVVQYRSESARDKSLDKLCSKCRTLT